MTNPRLQEVISQSTEPENQDKYLSRLAEWAAYVREPSGRFLALIRCVTQDRKEPLLVNALLRLFDRTKKWVILQHLALYYLDKSRPPEALYYSEWACSVSGCDPRALACRCRAHDLMGIPRATLYDLDVLRRRKRGVRCRAQRRELNKFIAEMYASSYLKQSHIRTAEKWIKYVERVDDTKGARLRDAATLHNAGVAGMLPLVIQKNLLRSSANQLRSRHQEVRLIAPRRRFLGVLRSKR